MTFEIQKVRGKSRFVATLLQDLNGEVAIADALADRETHSEKDGRAHANRLLKDALLGRFRRSEAYHFLSRHPATTYRIAPAFHRNKDRQQVAIEVYHGALAMQFQRRFCQDPA